jgi:hypothetical protein
VEVYTQNFCTFFFLAEYDDSNGDGGDDEDGNNKSDRAGDASGSRLVVMYGWKQKLTYSDFLVYRNGGG